MSKKQQTAVQWLKEQLKGDIHGYPIRNNLYAIEEVFDRAIAMEKEQMIDFGNNCVDKFLNDYWYMDTTVGQQLFTDTYQTEP